MFNENLAGALALIGIVILVASLLSGVIERSGLPQVGIFLVLGALLGPAGLGLINLTLESPTLQIIGTLALVLVLFSDAIAVDIGEVGRQRRLALVVLGPGTLIPAALVGLAGHLLLDLPWLQAIILGAALASTDPVLLRNLLRRSTLPPTARVALRLESGMNDVVLLPIVVLGILAVQSGGSVNPVEFGRHALGLFILGPAFGALVGYIAITLLEKIRSRVGVRRDYESLYALGVAFTAFAAAESVGGSGFVAAFAAGIVVAAMDVELCDCFLDYGQATAEMFLLFTFVAFGAWLIWTGFSVADGRTLLFAVLALAARTLVLLPVLARAGVAPRDRRLIAWFGPRGLSSLLLILLPVFAGMPGSVRLFEITCLVVLLSVFLHGAGIAAFLRKDAGPTSQVTTAPRPAKAEPAPEAPVPERITIAEMQRLQEAGEPVVLADVRTDRSYEADNLQAQGAIRLPPDDAVRRARELGLDHHGTVVLYCA
ncbi:MAG: sodium/hydrogen antiporter [Gemmatimonadales bacterium]|jgi:NhaP-type Na+/H+ or K+/H+ antiporter|nr:sodium/hydrogen antiporter [Gemmatimonadales bacterium]